MPHRVSQMGSTGGGDNLGKMAKNCMKITRSAFWGQNSGGGNNPIFWVVGMGGAIGETLLYTLHQLIFHGKIYCPKVLQRQ